jgi:hypothetical protein
MGERSFKDEIADALLRDEDLDLETYDPAEETKSAAVLLIVGLLGLVLALVTFGYCVGRHVR